MLREIRAGTAARDRALRVLILCADVGEGHVTVARALAARLRARDDVAAVSLNTQLDVLGERFGGFMRGGFDLHLGRIGWSYELAYRIFFERRRPREAAHLALAAFGGRALRERIESFRADVVVTEYPVLSATLGTLKALGRLGVPVCSSISDPAGLHYWAHPGIDLHLLSWPEALAETERIAGPGRAAVVRALVDERFHHPPTRAQARHQLSLPADAQIVLVSGGGWGVGDVEGAAWVALDSAPGARVLCLTGHNDELHARLSRTLAGSTERLTPLRYTERMPELLAAADALIHTTGGTTALEARVVGCPLVNYVTHPIHARRHAEAMARGGAAEAAFGRGQLAGALLRALARPRPVALRTARLPDAAALIVAAARNGSTS
jgi:processive 1,2-diacylglycerol beta-glucosyltransferase